MGKKIRRTGLAAGHTYAYTFDNEGNRTSRIEKDANDDVVETTTYAWDFLNRLTQVQTRNANDVVTQTVAYAYDAFGRRIRKTITDVTATVTLDERYVYNGPNMVATVDAATLTPEQTFETEEHIRYACRLCRQDHRFLELQAARHSAGKERDEYSGAKTCSSCRYNSRPMGSDRCGTSLCKYEQGRTNRYQVWNSNTGTYRSASRWS